MMEFVNELRIDPEFRDKIPPLTDAEYEQLRENILDAGEVYEPITVWNDTIVDGHNRWKIIQENPEIKYRVREMHFADKWEAFDWMYRNQLGRRNLTDAQRTYMIGKMYEARKQRQGGDRRSEEFSNTQSGNLKNSKQGTAGEIAQELGMGNNTVIRAEKFAKGVDALRGLSPESAEKVLSGKANVKKKDIMALAESDDDVVEAAADAILEDMAMPVAEDKPMSKPNRMPNGNSAEMREIYRTIDEAYAPMLDVDGEIVLTIDDLIEEIEINGKNYVNVLRSTVESKKHLIKGDEEGQMVFRAIANIIQEIVKVRGEYVK